MRMTKAAPRAVTHVTLPDGVSVEVTFSGGLLFANVPAVEDNENERPEADVVGLLLEAVQTFGPINVRKVHLTWGGVHFVGLDGPLFTALRDLPRLVSLALRDFVVTAGGATRPWPHLRSLHVLFQGDVMALLALFPRVERMSCWNQAISWFDDSIVNAFIAAALPHLHTVDVNSLCESTSHVLRLPASRRVVGYVFLPADPAVLAAIRDRASLPGAKRLMLSLTAIVTAVAPEAVDAALQDLCLAATEGGVTMDLRWDPFEVSGGAPRPPVLVDGGGAADRLRQMRRRAAAARVVVPHIRAWLCRPGGAAYRAAAERFAAASAVAEGSAL
jgi:hypothetical protein